MKVYVVVHGEKNEGCSVKHICLVRDKALNYVPMSISQDRNGKHTPGLWWRNDVDYIGVQEVELECTLEELTRACEEKTVEAFMESNVTEARIRLLVETLNCTRNKAISILQENNKCI